MFSSWEDFERFERFDFVRFSPNPENQDTSQVTSGDFDTFSLFINETDQKSDVFSWAVYGQTTYALTEKLNITGGLRYSFEEKEVVSEGRSPPSPLLGFPIDVLVTTYAPVSANESWENVDWRIAVDYSFQDDVMGYASIATGFKSGGFQGSPGVPLLAITPFDQEEVTNYEIGLKSQWLDNSLQLNVAGFYTDYTDLQVTRVTNSRNFPNIGVFVTENASDATIYGAEVELAWQPISGLLLDATYAYLDATYGEFTGTVASFDPATNTESLPNFDGNTLRQAPKNSASLGAKYTWDFNSGASLFFKFSARGQSRSYYNPENDRGTVIPGYTLVDGRLAYKTADERWNLSLWVKNLTDKLYIKHIYSIGGGAATSSYATFGEPRTVGLTAAWSFN